VNVRSGLGEELYTALDAHLADAVAALVRLYPGDDGTRQPMHTVYLPADRFHSGAAAEWGNAAAELLNAHAADTEALADIVSISEDLARQIYPRVIAKLAAEPIEDLRIDFEDGYGPRADDEEDATAVTAATGLGAALKAVAAPAEVVGLERKGRIAVGYDADFAVFAPDEAFVVDASRLFHRNPITPYAALPLLGRVRRTLLRGRTVADSGEIVGDPHGALLNRGGA
jgi:hypothetical protein